MQWGGGQQLRGIIDQRRVDEGAHRLQSDGGIHGTAGPHHPQRDTRGVERDAIRRHSGHL